ncbi:hypothetical protein ABZ896_32555 [Streptomyces sp. NPDC047072]|uniref:hypothetical protein n=1 Tax=Streptomyces sp. NPDC047072 TaxID=3154809 RepID=UPI0033E3A4C0
MSEYHYVFLHPGDSRRQLVEDVGAACGVELKPSADEFVDHSANLGHAAVELEFTHDYEDDHGIPFERYDALLTVRDFDSDLERQAATALRIFERLAAVDRYDLILIRDLQELLASSTRTSRHSTSGDAP